MNKTYCRRPCRSLGTIQITLVAPSHTAREGAKTFRPANLKMSSVTADHTSKDHKRVRYTYFNPRVKD